MVSVSDEKFDELCENLIRDALKLNPLMGTYLGLHQYDLLVPDYSREMVLKWLGVVKEYIRKFESVDVSELTGERTVEYPVILNQLKIWRIHLEE